MKRTLAQKIFSIFASFSIILQSVYPAAPLFAKPAFAEDATPAATTTTDNTQTPPVDSSTTTVDTSNSQPATPPADPVVTTDTTSTVSGTVDAPDDATGSATVATESGTTTTDTNTTTSNDTNTPNANDNSKDSSASTVSGESTVQTQNDTKHGDLSATVIKNVKSDTLTLNLDSQTAGSATVSTDKADYSPTDTVIVSGSNFIPNQTYTVDISSTDPPAVNFSTSVTTDSKGAFIYAYQLDGNYRPNYKVEVKLGSTIVAATTFTDSLNPATDISQCQNGGIGDPLQPCSETAPFAAASGYGYEGNANANHTNSHWNEGDFVPLRIVATNYSAGAGNIQFSIDITKSGKHAYDYIGSFDATETTGAPSSQHADHNNPVTDIIASGNPTSPDSTGAVPAASLSPFPVACGSDTFVGSQIAGSVKAWGTSGPLTVTYVSENVGSSDCVTTIQVAWTATQTSFGGTIVIAYGAHIAKQSDWGTGNSAINISGSPYHTSLVQYTTGGITKGIGQQDAKLAADAVIATPTGVTTVIHDASHATVTSVPVGTTVHDSATVTGTNPTGTVVFTFYNNGTCANTPAATSTAQTLVSGSVDATGFAQGPLAAGSYSFKAHYNGDLSNLASDGACEPLTVTKLSPSISTTLSSTSVGINVNVHDSSTLTGATANAGGTVTYHAYAGANTCTGTDLLNSQVTVTNGVVPNSANISFSNAGTYSFQAVYSGDANNNGATSVCSTEQLVVGKNSPTIATTLSATSVNVGTEVHDSSALTGATSNAGGSVTYTAYTNNLCTLGAQTGGTKTVTNGVVPDSNGITFNTAGDYYWQAVYSGDANNNGATSTCTDEHLVVNRLNSTTVTAIHNPNHGVVTSVDAGSTVHDSATVTGSGPTPTGNVNFRFYSNGTCTGDGTAAGTVALNGSGIADPSTSEGPLNAGSYSFKATYGGNGTYNGSTGDCEPLTVNQLTPNVATDIHNANHQIVTTVDLGSTIHDSASVSGTGPAVTGTVSFLFYNNGVCSGDGTAAGNNISLVNGIADPSSSEGPLSAGSYSFKAHYNGDTNYVAAYGNCEPLTVSKGSLSLTTTIYDNSDNNAVLGALALGSTVYDQATVSGIIGNIAPTNPVTFAFFPNDTCTNDTGSSAGSVALVGNVANHSDLEGPLNAGLFSFHASIADDSNYTGATSSCEPLTINKGKVTVHKRVDNGDGFVDGDKSDFRWQLDDGSDIAMGGSADIVDTNKHEITENTVPGYIPVGWYEYFGEGTDFSCQSPESTQFPISFNEPNGVERTFVICNQLQNPILTITKINDASGDKNPGDSVLFTLTVTATQSAVNNVQVTDLPAGGFHYRLGSWTANSSDTTRGVGGDLKAGAITPEPTYASPGLWQLGNMKIGETVTLTYIADIDGSEQPGLYKDVAWAQGTSLASTPVLAEAINPGFVADNFVGTQVNIVKDQFSTTHVNIEGTVLGASTSLPATGAPTIWVIMAALLTTLGGLLLAFGIAMKKSKKLNKFLAGAFAVLVAGVFLFGSPASTLATGTVSVRIESPKSPTSQNSFNINFVALDRAGQPVTAKCFKQGPSDGSFSQFGPDIALSAGGNSNNCVVDGSVISNEGTYQFKVTATNGTDSDEATTSVEYKLSNGPDTPVSYSKSQPNSCQFKIDFKTANDGGRTVKVGIYRSTTTSFAIDSSTQVGMVGIGSNANGSFTDSVPECNKTYYYAIRAYDSAGNGSGVIGDSVTTTIPGPVVPATGGTGAIPVSGGTGGAGSVLGQENTSTEGGAGTGGVLGETTPSAEVKDLTGQKPSTGFLSSPKLLGLLGLIVIIAAYVFYRRSHQV